MSADDWVVCCPGDPTDAQWAMIIGRANGRRFCAEQWNASTGDVRFTVDGAGAERSYTVAPNGVVSNR